MNSRGAVQPPPIGVGFPSSASSCPVCKVSAKGGHACSVDSRPNLDRLARCAEALRPVTPRAKAHMDRCSKKSFSFSLVGPLMLGCAVFAALFLDSIVLDKHRAKRESPRFHSVASASNRADTFAIDIGCFVWMRCEWVCVFGGRVLVLVDGFPNRPCPRQMQRGNIASIWSTRRPSPRAVLRQVHPGSIVIVSVTGVTNEMERKDYARPLLR